MRWVNAGIIVFLLFFLVFSTRSCEDAIQTRQNVDTMQGKVDKYKAEIDSLKAEYLTLLNSRAVKIKTLREIRRIYLHDTLTVEALIGDTSGIANLLSENALMKEIVFEDSLIIANQGQVIVYQDSVISHLEAITATQKEMMGDYAKQVKKERRKANFWKTVSVVFGLIAVAK